MSGFLGWLRHPQKGFPYFLCCLICLLLAHFFLFHYYISFYSSKFKTQSSFFDENLYLNQSLLRKLQNSNPGNQVDVLLRIEELNRIKNSVNKELVGLEKKRRQIMDEITNLTNVIKLLKEEHDNKINEIDQTLVSLSHLKMDLEEIKKNNQPSLESPLYIQPPSQDLESDMKLNEKDSGKNNYKPFCSMTLCFDYSRCSLFSHFPVFVYKFSSSLSSSSSLFSTIFQIFSTTNYITTNPKLACLFVYILEPDITSMEIFNNRLKELSYFRFNTEKSGVNHLLVNPYSHISLFSLSTSPFSRSLQTGKALIAQSVFPKNLFRSNFDVILPPLFFTSSFFTFSSPFSFSPSFLPMMVPIRREHLMAYSGNLSIKSKLKYNILNKIVSVLTFMKKNFTNDNFDFNLNCNVERYNYFEDDNNDEKFESEDDFPLCDDNSMEAMHLSTFSLILIKSHVFGLKNLTIATNNMLVRLINAFKSGAVPVVLGEKGEMELPFQNIISYEGSIIWLPVPRITEMHYYIRSFVDVDIFEMRRRGRLIYEMFFSSPSTTIQSLLSSFRTRLSIPPPPATLLSFTNLFNSSFPQLEPVPIEMQETSETLGPLEPPFASLRFQRNFSSSFIHSSLYSPFLTHSFLHSNLPFKPLLSLDAKFIGSSFGFRPIGEGVGGAGKEFKEALGGDNPREQFTVVILTFDREMVLLNAVARLRGLPYLNKVIVIWNSPQPPSSLYRWPDIGVPVEALNMLKNSLNNRFLPLETLDTEAVLSLDDDVHLRHDEIIFAFRVWRQNRDQIVGFPGRFVSFYRNSSSFFYNSNYSCEMSMVLTGAAFIHKFYFYAYTNLMPAPIRDLVDEHLNCEDIAMNFLVSHITRKPPIKVTSRWTFSNRASPTGLSQKFSHFETRHKCIQLFIEIYGYLPLQTTQYRADSILFKTRIPHNMQKCFKYV